MIVKELPQEFLDAKPIIETIKQAGFEAYFVGGSVRDTLLGLPIHDVDIATSAYPQEIKKILKTSDNADTISFHRMRSIRSQDFFPSAA